MQYIDLEFGKKTLRFWDENKVELKKFNPDGQEKSIRFFRKKNFNQWDKNSKIISRSSFSSFREPFIIEPWNQILIDEANKYGLMVDSNKELALMGKISDSEVLKETRMSVAKIMKQDLIWVARAQMICHADSLIYGEVDEIWYSKKDDIYFIGDTKTSSSVDKMTYWYQLSIYIEILRSLNPDKKISGIGMIDWVKIKKEKWVYNKKFNENSWKEWIGEKDIKSSDPVYRAKWNEKVKIPIEETNLLIKRDLERDGVINQARQDLNLIKKYNIFSADSFNNLLNNSKFIEENDLLQKKYEYIKENLK